MEQSELEAFCRKTWGRTPDKLAFPGGAGRKTVVVSIREADYVVSKRRSSGRAALEAEALRQLAHTDLVPQLVLRDEDWIVQEFIHGERLTFHLERASPTQRLEQTKRVAAGLLALQQAGTASLLMKTAPKIGGRPGWVEDFARMPEALARDLGVNIGSYEPERLVPFLQNERRVFVKWDSRPGNALVQRGGQILWFDWEHCGLGAPEDDLVWFFADESTPIVTEALASALTATADAFDQDRTNVEQRFFNKSVLHSLFRLRLILKKKGDSPWWSARDVLQNDRLGVTQPHVQRLCRRSVDWAQCTDACKPLLPLLERIWETAL